MKIKLLLLIGCFYLASAVMAQSDNEPWVEGGGKMYYTYTDESGETYAEVNVDEVMITAQRRSRKQIRKGKKRLKKLTRLRWNVHKVYPYAVKVGDLLRGAYATLDSIPNEKERKKFIKSKEKVLFGEYEPAIRKMSRSQGKVLVKLVDRETGDTMFSLISDVKSGASAVFWNSVGSIFGINLKSEYNPKEDDDAIEAIVSELENGGYNIYYKTHDYTLP